MAHWTDDRHLNIEQKRLDARQAEAREKMASTNMRDGGEVDRLAKSVEQMPELFAMPEVSAETDAKHAAILLRKLERALAESRAEVERLMTIAGWGGLAADAPERLILASEMFDGIACCDKWQSVYRVVDDGQPMPESATAYVRADVADQQKARAERLAEALREIAAPLDCGCKPCHGYCRNDAWEWMQETALAALEQEPPQ